MRIGFCEGGWIFVVVAWGTEGGVGVCQSFGLVRSGLVLVDGWEGKAGKGTELISVILFFRLIGYDFFVFLLVTT